MSFNEKIESLKEELVKSLKEVPEGQYVKLNYEPTILECIIFEDAETGLPPIDMHGSRFTVHKVFSLEKDLLVKIDFSNVSFDYFEVHGIDFTGLHNVQINPQKVYNKDLTNTILNGVIFTGPFDDVVLYDTNFAGSKNAIINPNKLRKHRGYLGRFVLERCVFSDVVFTDAIKTFDISSLRSCDFSNSIGAKIDIRRNILDLRRDKGTNLDCCNFDGVKIVGSTLKTDINWSVTGTNFSGMKRKKTLKLYLLSGTEYLENTNFDGVTIKIGKDVELVLENTSFKGSKGAVINLNNVRNYSKLDTCDFRDARVFDRDGKELFIDEFGKLSTDFKDKVDAALSLDYETLLKNAEDKISEQAKKIRELEEAFKEKTSEILNLCERLENQQVQNSVKTLYASIPISQDMFLKVVDDHYEINTETINIEKLRFFNLSMIDFTNVNVRGVDFRGSRAQINPQRVYQKDISGCKFDDSNITPFIILNGVNDLETDYSSCTYVPVMVRKNNKNI